MSSPSQPSPSPAEETRRFEFSHKVLIASGIAVTMAMLALFLWYAVYVLFLIFAGVLLAIFLRALSDLISQYTKLGHRWSLAIVLVVLLGGLTAMVWMMGQSIYNQVIEFADKLPQSFEAFRIRLES